MDIKKLQKLVVSALEDIKAQDIQLFDTMHLTSMFDRIAIASGTSNRQTKALAASVRDKVKEAGGQVLSMEGENTGEWVLVDLGDMVVHIMQPTIRAYYRLEEIWGDKPVSLATAKRAARKSAEEPVKAGAAPRKTTRHVASTTPAEVTPKKRAPSKTAVKSDEAKKASPKSPVKKAVAAKKPAATKKATASSTKAPIKRASTKSKAEK